MENRINQVVSLDSGKKYYILKQAVYKEENYFLVAEVAPNEEKLNEKFGILKETIRDGETYVELEKDPAILSLILKHLGMTEE